MKQIIKITELPKVNIFKVPEGYFDTLPMSIQERITFSEEPVVNFGKKQNFGVPDNYFDTLSSRIINRIASIEQTVISLDTLPKANVFKVPEGYFENAAESMSAHAIVESIERKNIFEVPANYFDELPARILSKTQEPKVIKVNWWKQGRVMWTAAASIVLMIGVGLAIPQFSQSKSEAAFAALSNDDISSYLSTTDLSYVEYEMAASKETPLPKGIETKMMDDLEINKKDILDHLESQDLEDI